jgi:hypothetical protein
MGHVTKGGDAGARLSRSPAKERELPAWAANATRALANAAGRVRMISACTPVNFRAELDRLTRGWSRGPLAPRFEHAPPTRHEVLRHALSELAAMLDREGLLGRIYADRARELCAEADVCEAAGTDQLRRVALRRFGPRDEFDAAADALALTWLSEAPGRAPGARALVRTDDETDPRSLVARLRAELGARRLPVRVILCDDLASLAAAGDGVVHVVTNRWITRRDAERTVMHELDGHIGPRLASLSQRLGIFGVGSAGGSDDQEGRALFLERSRNFLDRGRQLELALRHVAARGVQAGACFVDTARQLLDHGAPLSDALRIAARAHRGGGLAREAVYLPALLRVESLSTRHPAALALLGRGRISTDVALELARAAPYATPPPRPKRLAPPASSIDAE